MSLGPGLYFIESENLRGNNAVSSEAILKILFNKTNAKIRGNWISERIEFWELINKWLNEDPTHFPLLYISSHGFPGFLEIGRWLISVQELADTIKGYGKNRTIFISSCMTLADQDSRRRFEHLGLNMLIGYKESFAIKDTLKSELKIIFRVLLDSTNSY